MSRFLSVQRIDPPPAVRRRSVYEDSAVFAADDPREGDWRRIGELDPQTGAWRDGPHWQDPLATPWGWLEGWRRRP